MEQPNDRTSRLEWESLLAHRHAEDRSVAARRLENAGITPELLRETFLSFGDNVSTTTPADSTTVLLQRAALLSELNLFLLHASQRASSLRRRTFLLLLEKISLTEIATFIGVTKQAIHRAIQRAPKEPYEPDVITPREGD